MKQLISNELKDLGFSTEICPTGVIVSLNRKINTMEVKQALSQVFDEIEFVVKSIGNAVLVRE